ncbi:hypothetical protein [Pseudomonas sp. 5Ae-yellow]|uniref:hypothetical protein n=1 Tax=Pseudomonas sp. 5Ae-yellow TaxID=2759848 RepID=UPI0015F4D1A2|nr:hypothetical protein [Pseudomonas sp. 5Ae-yellow]MBA6420921.1 hypothetical protein [Pseudomonas sp. 5Ae-yellow]
MKIRDQCLDRDCVDVAIGSRINELSKIASAARGERAAQENESAMVAAETELQRKKASTFAQPNAADKASFPRDEAVSLIATQPELSVENEYAEEGVTYPPPEAYEPVVAASPAEELPIWKYGLVLLALLTGLAVLMHRNDSLTIYIDFTDAIVTNVLPMVGGAVGLLLWFLEFPSPVPMYAALLGVASAVGFATVSSVTSNGYSYRCLLSIVAKLTLAAAFFILIAVFLFAQMPTRFKDESRAQAEARNRRAVRESRLGIAATSVGYGALIAWVCRYKEFSKLSECLSFVSNEMEPRV